jgi:hypothetical protein
MTNAQRALDLVYRFEAIASAEPTKFRDHGGIEKGWTTTTKAKVALDRARRADRLYARCAGLAPTIRPNLP